MTVESNKKCILKNDDSEANEKLIQITYWFSIYVASALSFIGSVQFSLYYSSLWPYLQIIDHSITESFFGYIISIYSLGQIISSPIFGYWSNRLCKVSPLLYIGLFMMLIGNSTYIYLEIIKFPKRYILLFGRFITGVGSGNIALLRTYASTASAPKDRSKAIAFITCGQAIGLICGPALQLLFTSLKYPGVKLFDGLLHLNLYTAPAYLACAMNVFGIFILYFFLEEKYQGVVESKNNEKKLNVPPYDIIAVIICLLTRFTYMFISTNLDVIGSPYSMMMFAWTESTTVFFTSLAQGIIGLVTLGVYIIWITMRLERYLNFRICCILALLILMIFHLLTYSWPFLSGNVHLQNRTALWSIEIIDSVNEPVGCDVERFVWCKTLKPVNVWVYYISYILSMSTAFPILNITNTTLYGDVLGPRRQGTEQGILQMAGSFSRFFGPIAISTLYSIYGPTIAWNMEIIIIFITIIVWIIFYHKMVPLLERHQYDNIHPMNNESISVCNEISKDKIILTNSLQNA